MDVLIYHHLGLGDHIICNGLVNHISDDYDKVLLLSYTTNAHSVVFLYRNNPKITVIEVPDNAGANAFFESFSGHKIRVGFDYLKTTALLFDKAFYSQAGIPFAARWDRFALSRDLEAEKELFATYGVQEKEYVFLHEDIKRHYVLNRKYVVNKGFPIVSPIPDLTKNVFSYCYLIENAAEIHCMDSSFKSLADSIRLNTRLLYYHLYVRGRDRRHVSSSRLPWTSIYFRNSLIESLVTHARRRNTGL